jgi:hypothetical protein
MSVRFASHDLLMCLAVGWGCCVLLSLGCQPKTPIPANPSATPKSPTVVKNPGEPALALDEKAGTSLIRGVDWLLAEQAEDGGWHSETYGPFKGGAATTSLVLYAASQLPVDVRCQHAEAWKRAWKFLEPGVRKKGFVVCPDGTMDEPVYATALVLLAQHPLRLGIEPELLTSMENFLLNERCGKERGFKPDDPNYGGWDLAGGTGLGGDTPGSNVSITRFAVEALPPQVRDSEFASVLLVWAKRVQNLPGDGGFFFHPQQDHEGNKAQWADGDSREKPRSYGTATCDGLLLLASLDVPLDDPILRSGIKWLVDHPAAGRVPGFEDVPPETGWQQGLLFYYLMSLSQASSLLPEEVRFERRQAILKQLLSMQKDDGQWQNESARMREDDPLIATSFAVVALSELLK